MAQEVDYDLDELLGGSVATITAAFGDLSVNQLGILADKERAAEKPRQTLLSAVETEQAARAAQAQEIALLQAAQRTMQEGQEAAAKILAMGNGEPQAPTYDQLAQRVRELMEENIGLRALLGDAADNQGEEQEAAPAKPQFVMVRADAIDKPRGIIFAGANDRVLTELTPLQFFPADFAKEGSGITLNKVIDFPLHGVPQEVHSVWVIGADGFDPESESTIKGWPCHLIHPLHVSGGRSAQIPAGHLMFDAGKAA